MPVSTTRLCLLLCLCPLDIVSSKKYIPSLTEKGNIKSHEKKNTYATKAPRLARVGKNTNNFTIIPDSITTVLRQFLEKISSNCRIVMCLVEPNDGDNTKGGSEAAFGRGSR